MRTDKPMTRAEIVRDDMETLALWMLTEARQRPATREDTRDLILEAVERMRQIRRSYPLARPQMRGL